MKIKASELRKSLKDKGLDDVDVELLVKAKVDADEAEDDEAGDDDGDIDASQIDAFADRFEKSRQSPLFGGASDALAKSNTGEPGDLLHLLETFAAAQDETLGRLDDNHTILGEGLLAVGQTTKALAKAFDDVRKGQRELNTLLVEVRDRLGEPVAPRAVETGDQGGGSGSGSGTLSKAAQARSLGQAAVAEMKRPETTRDRLNELNRAVKALSDGEDPATVAKTYKLTI